MSETKNTSIGHALVRSGGAISEGNIFSVLRHSPYVLRGSEFAAVDGAINCSTKCNYAPLTPFAERLDGMTNRRHPSDVPLLILFDVKSTILNAKYSLVHTWRRSDVQRGEVAFFIGHCASDSSYVEIIPNREQVTVPGVRRVADVVKRKIPTCRLPPQTYVLSPRQAPYRMPLHLLCDAISAIRDAVINSTPFSNPWTKVQMPDWSPAPTTSSELLWPAEGDMFSSYLAIEHLYRLFKTCPQVSLEMVDIQPRIADFKLVVHGVDDQPAYQRFVQHKIDGTVRNHGSVLRRVPIVRTSGDQDSWYFHAFERFDFVWFQFEYRMPDGARPHRDFFFLPERAIPNEFYTTTDRCVSFERIEFVPYRIPLDVNGRWLARVHDIMRRTPQPRRLGHRPVRQVLSLLDEAGSNSDSAEESLDELVSDIPPVVSGTTRRKPSEFSQVFERGHRQFFHALNAICAARQVGSARNGVVLLLTDRRRSGLLIVQSPQTYCYMRYRWTETERDRFVEFGRPPRTLSDLGAADVVIMVTYFPRARRVLCTGLLFQASEFDVLNSSKLPRLVLWGMGGADRTESIAPAIVPSEDIQPTSAQRSVFAACLQDRVDAHRRRIIMRSPTISSTLSTGLLLSDYAVSQQGPSVYDDHGCDWARVLSTIDKFVDSDCASFEYPPGADLWRSAADHRITVGMMHQESYMVQHRLPLMELGDAGNE